MAVTKGTFPSHLELSKSRSQLAGLAAGPCLGPPPQDCGHTDTWRGCAADVGLGGSQKPRRVRARHSQLGQGAVQASPSSEVHLCLRTLP